MKKKIHKKAILTLAVALCFLIASTASVFASDQKPGDIQLPVKDGETLSIASNSSNSSYIRTPHQKYSLLFYRGEVIDVYFEVDDVWEDYYCAPVAMLYNSSGKLVAQKVYSAVPNNGTLKKTTNFSTKKLPEGRYQLFIVGVAVDENEDVVEDVDTSEYEHYQMQINLRTLKSPKAVKAKAGKKKVIVTYRDAEGASKYKIYRATKKNGKYKKIATTKKTKYVDKKVKKGKKYFYKVKSVRNYNKTVTSKFSKIAKSKKVKR